MTEALSGEVLSLVPDQAGFPEDSLSYAERRIKEALERADAYSWQAIGMLYEIYRTGAWRLSFDEDGFPIRNFERYIESLRGRVPRLSKRWAQQVLGALCALETLGMGLGDLQTSSPAKIVEVAKTLDFDRRKGILRGFKIAGGKEAVLRLLEEATDPEVRYTDLRSRVRTELGTPETSWAVMGSAPLYEVTAYHDDLAYCAHLQVGHDFPPAALDDLRRRLGCP